MTAHLATTVCPSDRSAEPESTLSVPFRRERHDLVATAWLFAVFQLFYALSASGRFHAMDEYASFYTTESLVERGTLSLPRDRRFFGREALDGSFYTPYGPLRAVVAVPGYLVGRRLAGLSAADPVQVETLLWFGTSLTNTTIAALAVAVFFLLVSRLGARPLPALLATLTFALATPHWHYATTYFSEPLTTLLLLAAAFLLAGLVGRHPAPSGRQATRLFLAALPLALAAAERLTTALVFPVYALAVLALVGGSAWQRVRAATAYCAPPLIAIAFYLMWNWWRFGDPLEIGYPDSFEGDRPPDAFEEPFLRGLYGLTLSPGKGLFLSAMPALLGLVCWREMHGRAGWRASWLLVVPLVPLLFYSKFSYWEGAYSWGPRYLVPVIPFWIAPLAFLSPASRPARAVYVFVAAFSAGLTLLGVSVSFLECQVDRGYYLPGFRYNLDYSLIATTLDVNLQYARAALDGRFLAEPVGLGFDRWWFLLAKCGFDSTAIATAVAALGLLLAGAACGLARALRRPSPEASGERAPAITLSR
jgi:hypothetical protein